MGVLRFLLLLVALCVLSACRSNSAGTRAAHLATTRPATRPVGPPLIDLRRGRGSFPLGGGPVDSAGALEESLREGYVARMVPAKPDFITLRGPLDSIRLFRVDASYSRVRADYRPAAFGKTTKTERTLNVRRLEYVADPLGYNVTSARLTLVADDARLDLLRDAKDVRGLVLTGARRGAFEFHASSADLNKFMTIAPHGDGAASNLTILRTTFSFKSEAPHTLGVEVDVRARWVLLPMTFTVRGRVTASADGVLTFSDLGASGYDPGGLLAAAFLNSALKEMEGQSQAVLSFPDPRTHVTDVRFDTRDGVTFTVDFGR